MTTTAPPPSPSKRPGLLRSVVTSIDRPVDRDTHAQRWHRAPAGPRSPHSPNVQGATGSGGGGSTSESSRVRSLVQGWEQASLGTRSRPDEALSPAPTSPYRTHSAAGDVSNDRPALRVNSNQRDLAPGGPTSPTRGTSPTVPASFFQKQVFARTASDAPVKFDPQQQRNRAAQPGKENWQPPSSPAAAPRLPHINMAPLMSASMMSARTDLTMADSDAQTALTVETMATRSSGSTHASSLVTNLTPQPVRPEAATRFGTFSRTAVNGPRDQPAPASAPAQPQSRPPFPSHMSTSPPSRPVMNHRPVSSFIEALPPRPSAPSPPHDTARSTSPRHAWDEPSRYSPLPLDRSGSPPPLTATSKASTTVGPPLLATKGRRRPRSSSVGDGVRPTGPMAFDAPKETRPAETAWEKTKRIEAEFARLLDTMQLPDPTVRSRMLGLALPLKEEMLRTAAVTSPTLNATSRSLHQRGRSMNTLGGSSFLPPSGAATANKGEGRAAPGPASSSTSGNGIKSFLRKAKSNSSLRSQNLHDAAAIVPSTPTSSSGGGGRRARSKSHSRTASSSSMFRSLGKSSGAGVGATVSDMVGDAAAEGPAFWASRLRTGTIETLRVKELGRLRGRLRNESPVWIDEFVKEGGYIGLLERLKDLLDKEWREEQHDDQILHELLRCFKALTMTNIGKRTLASYSPTPFLPLAALLFSEKRPGDLPCRQILVELVHALFQICPPACDTLPKSAWSDTTISLASSPPPPDSFATTSKANGYESGTGSGGVRRYTRRAKLGDDDDDESAFSAKSDHHLEREEILTPERIQQAHRFAVSLMRGPPDEEEEAKVDFVRRAHRERAYKVWVKEIADCVRDYFWVFCHANNLFWTLEQIDAEAVEAPKVPSGMTGGVEYEAMAYCTAHLRLINEVARTCPTQEAAFAFHEQLFLSGFERVLFTLRRASLVYYQSLHLEMSRYISLARSARFNLGPRILACLDRRFLRPEEQMVLLEAERRNHQTRSGAPQLGAVF